MIDTGLWRTLNVLIGIVIALAFSFALPLHATYSWRYLLADNLRGCARIYTRLGDGGETHLGDMSRVPKTDPRIEAYGTVDELNSQLGVTLTLDGLDDQHAAWIRHIQNDLFDVGADIAAPEDPARERLRVLAEQTAWLEQRCDEVNATLAPLKSFVLPGGTAAAAHLHVCRTVCRRAERRVIACGDQVSPETVRYLNRLSDLLFILSRAANHGDEPLWEPGRFR